MPNWSATRCDDERLRLQTLMISHPAIACNFGICWAIVFPPAPTIPILIVSIERLSQNHVDLSSYRAYAVAFSNVALPAAAWYFPLHLLFVFSLCERKTNNKKKITYRSAEG